MSMLTGAIAVIVLVAVFLFDRKRRTHANVRPDESRKGKKTSNNQFHAVSLKCAANACQAAKELSGRRFLSSAAPRLPLRECNVLECSCRFAHHTDRRGREDRRSPFRQKFGAIKGEQGAEQRGIGERRSGRSDFEF